MISKIEMKKKKRRKCENVQGVAGFVVGVEASAAVAEEDLAALPADVRQVLVDDEAAVAVVEREALAPPGVRPLLPLRVLPHH
jgi:transcription antitermination factor NusG